MFLDFISDEMEFEVTSDQRTGKPIACHLVKLDGGTVSFEVSGTCGECK